VAKATRSRFYFTAVLMFDVACAVLWWVPGVARLWSFVANRTTSR
jgi:hypothetical protein